MRVIMRVIIRLLLFACYYRLFVHSCALLFALLLLLAIHVSFFVRSCGFNALPEKYIRAFRKQAYVSKKTTRKSQIRGRK